MSIRLLIFFLFLSLILPAPAVAQELYDVVILGGRVIDPETGRDEIANVGILGDQIQANTADDIRGRKTIDASGQIVAPGFIDILASMRLDRDAHEFKIGDGVSHPWGFEFLKGFKVVVASPRPFTVADRQVSDFDFLDRAPVGARRDGKHAVRRLATRTVGRV